MLTTCMSPSPATSPRPSTPYRAPRTGLTRTAVEGGGGQTSVLADDDLFLRDQVLQCIDRRDGPQLRRRAGAGRRLAERLRRGRRDPTGRDGRQRVGPVERGRGRRLRHLAHRGQRGRLRGVRFRDLVRAFSAATGQELWNDDIGTEIDPDVNVEGFDDSAWVSQRGRRPAGRPGR